MLRQRLAAARALYSEKRYDASAEAFTGVLMLLEDPAMAKAAGSDLQSMTALATGFRDLSLAADEQVRAAAARQAPAPESTSIAAATPGAPDSTAAAAPATTPASEPAPAPAPAASSSFRHAGHRAPRPSRRRRRRARPTSCRRWPSRRRFRARPTSPCRSAAPQTILLDIVIDETGRVERAEVRRSVNRLYEAQLVAATRGWRYTPATQAGRPVKYARTLEVTLNPRD